MLENRVDILPKYGHEHECYEYCTQIGLNATLSTVEVHVDLYARELIYSLENEGATTVPCTPCFLRPPLIGAELSVAQSDVADNFAPDLGRMGSLSHFRTSKRTLRRKLLERLA